MECRWSVSGAPRGLRRAADPHFRRDRGPDVPYNAADNRHVSRATFGHQGDQKGDVTMGRTTGNAATARGTLPGILSSRANRAAPLRESLSTPLRPTAGVFSVVIVAFCAITESSFRAGRRRIGKSPKNHSRNTWLRLATGQGTSERRGFSGHNHPVFAKMTNDSGGSPPPPPREIFMETALQDPRQLTEIMAGLCRDVAELKARLVPKHSAPSWETGG